MRASHLWLLVLAALLCGNGSLGSTTSARAEPPPPAGAGVVSDDELTIVVGTRFVTASASETSAKAQFNGARVPLSAFNETDHCIDQAALDIAREYFDTLGRLLAKAAQYYFVPDDAIKDSVAECERITGRPPQAWVESKTKVIAFGKVVPTVDAAALEQSIR